MNLQTYIERESVISRVFYACVIMALGENLSRLNYTEKRMMKVLVAVYFEIVYFSVK